MRLSSQLVVMVLGGVVAACGFSSSGAPDGGVGDDVITPPSDAMCGNSLVEDGEQCDDPLDRASCDNDCHLVCGNGVVDAPVGELCDTAITSGEGACPTSCNDGDACTADVLTGAGCQTACTTSPIIAAADGDGCCPAGANANTDSDCSAMCGNGLLEPGELCDPAITAGAGACPTSCNDAQTCTTDALVNAGSCQAHCVFTPITTNTAGDGCCLQSATPAEDSDCAGCGNGVVEPDLQETCDTGIASGAGACPTTCNDADACTTDTLANAGTCKAVCTYPAITAPTNGDGCCPAGANANNDDDCAPICGNGVREGSEACDDGNTNNSDACSNTCTVNVVPTAFRFGSLAMTDPHAFTRVAIFCPDITSQLNDQFTTALTTDGSDADTYLDLSPVLVFRPLGQTAASSPLEVNFANCPTATSCMPGADPSIVLTATNQATGTCLTPIPGTRQPYSSPAMNSPTGPCFSSTATTVQLSLSGVQITLHDARISATYAGSPATKLVNGLMYGFLTEADANATILPTSIAVVGGKKFSEILRGGTGNCKSGSDKDVNNGVSGWWIYLNYAAPVTTWTE